jgi:DNA-binding NarL/FixJ family response regulator
MAADPVRILLVDNHPFVLVGLKAIIGKVPDFEIVGEAGDGPTALRLAREHRPNVVILDISLPGMDGTEVVTSICAEHPEIRLLLFTVREDGAYLRRFLELGVSGYLLKSSAPDELVYALKTVAAGGVYIDPHIADKLVGRFSVRPRPADVGATVAVSDREADVLRLVATGHTNSEIALHLNISVNTVQSYKVRAMGKLGFRGRADIVRYAAQQGWLPKP